jgi:hypothetical protein
VPTETEVTNCLVEALNRTAPSNYKQPTIRFDIKKADTIRQKYTPAFGARASRRIAGVGGCDEACDENRA